MDIDGSQQKQLHEALMSAFPTQRDLEIMVTYELNENLSAIVGSNNLKHATFELIQWARATGRLGDLISGAIKQNNQNPQLIRFTQQLSVNNDYRITYGFDRHKITPSITTASAAIPNEEAMPSSQRQERTLSLPSIGTLVTDKRRLPQWPSRRKLSLTLLLPLSIITIAVTITCVSLAVFQTSITSTVMVRPQVQMISKVYTIKAQPGLTSPNVAASAIPINMLQETDSTQDTTSTTGTQSVCVPLPCPKIVSADDISRLATKEHQQLKQSLTQKLNQELQQKQASTAGDINCVDTNGNANPPEGTQSDTVTVSLTVVCTAKFYVTSDARTLASSLLQKDVTAHFQLLGGQRTVVGQAVVRGTDPSGAVTLLVPVAGVAEYQFSDADKQNIQSLIKGMKKKDAMALIAQQTGVDPQGIEVAVTYGGDTLPDDVNQISVQLGEPLNVPTPQLPPVPNE